MKKVAAVLAAVAFFASANVANAFWFPWGNQSSSDINVSTSNSASVNNNVTTKANTGKNYTDAGSARVRVHGSGDNGGNTANGGDSDVDTGDATAGSEVYNDVNYTDVDIDTDCGCKGDITVDTDNRATVSNTVYTKANTGLNETDAGSAKVSVSGSENHHHGWWWLNLNNDEDNNGDNDANGGDSDVTTGDAVAGSSVENYVNTTMVRVRR